MQAAQVAHKQEPAAFPERSLQFYRQHELTGQGQVEIQITVQFNEQTLLTG
jgi:hypothetical protein